MSTGSSIESSGSQLTETYDSMSSTEIFDMLDDSSLLDGIGQFSDRTEIEIVVQPVDKFRFRYRSEMTGTHGRLLGETDETSRKKEFPTVKLINCEHEDAFIRCTLVTADEDKRLLHAHHLVRKYENEDKDDPHDINVSNKNNYIASFCNMGIIHTAKKDVKEEMKKKLRMELLDHKKIERCGNLKRTTDENCKIEKQAKEAQKTMNLNKVCLCFQGFRYDEDNILFPLTEKIYSRPINNLKSAKTGELRICRIDKHTGSCKGNEEVWLLVEKVDKKNIRVKFYDVDEDDKVIWEAEGKFSELDVHHQYAIVVQTPAYKNINITEPTEVFVRLERPTDGEVSDSIKFVYSPSEKKFSRKRPRIESPSTSFETVSSTEPAEQFFNNNTLEVFTTLPADDISRTESPSTSFETVSSTEPAEQFFNNSPSEVFITLPGDDISRTESPSTSFGMDSSTEAAKQLHNNILSKALTAAGISSLYEEPQKLDIENGVTYTNLEMAEFMDTLEWDTLFSYVQGIESDNNNLVPDGVASNRMINCQDFAVETLKKIFSLYKGMESNVKIQSSKMDAHKMLSKTVNFGNTPLHFALQMGQFEVAKCILACIATDPMFKSVIDLQNDVGQTPLHVAAYQHQSEIVRTLLELGADPNICDDEDTTPLHIAVKEEANSTIHELLQSNNKLNLEAHTESGWSALHLGAKAGSLYAVKALIGAGVDVNATDMSCGRTALHIAIESNHVDVVTYLLTETKINVNAKNFGGNTALHTAVAKGDKYAEEFVKILREYEAGEEEEDHNSIPPTIPLAMEKAVTTLPISEIENSDSDESSFDLACDDSKSMKILGQPKEPTILKEKKLDSKEEFHDEIIQQHDRADGRGNLAQQSVRSLFNFVRGLKSSLAGTNP